MYVCCLTDISSYRSTSSYPHDWVISDKSFTELVSRMFRWMLCTYSTGVTVRIISREVIVCVRYNYLATTTYNFIKRLLFNPQATVGPLRLSALISHFSALLHQTIISHPSLRRLFRHFCINLTRQPASLLHHCSSKPPIWGNKEVNKFTSAVSHFSYRRVWKWPKE